MIRPFAENIERQKRFLTDVSHELKTPLGIISANTGVLELTKGKDEWTESIRNQVKRLDSLIKDLIELSKSEEYVKESEFTEFSVSQIAETNADSFRTLAQMQGKQLNAEIEPGVCMRGQEDSIIRLMTILLDNGVKYCDPSGTVELRLRQKGRQVVLQVAIHAGIWIRPRSPICLTGSIGRTVPVPAKAAVMESDFLLQGR